MNDSDPMKGLAEELVGESAASLGKAGKALQAALDLLAAVDAGTAAPTHPPRALVVADAAERAWEYVVLRGALGWHDDASALGVYQVPQEVRRQMGVRGR